MSFLNRIFVQPTVTIYAEGTDIVLDYEGKKIREQPLLRVADDGKIVAISSEAEKTTGGRLIRLFTPGGGGDDAAIRGFFRYLIALALSGSTFRRPRIEIVATMLRKSFGAGAAENLVRVLRSDGFNSEIVDSV